MDATVLTDAWRSNKTAMEIPKRNIEKVDHLNYCVCHYCIFANTNVYIHNPLPIKILFLQTGKRMGWGEEGVGIKPFNKWS